MAFLLSPIVALIICFFKLLNSWNSENFFFIILVVWLLGEIKLQYTSILSFKCTSFFPWSKEVLLSLISVQIMLLSGVSIERTCLPASFYNTLEHVNSSKGFVVAISIARLRNILLCCKVQCGRNIVINAHLYQFV